MLAPSHLAISEELPTFVDAGTPPARPVGPPLVRPGLRYELLLHRPCAEDENERSPEPRELFVPESPRRAIHMLRDSVRGCAGRLAPRDRHAILGALDDHRDSGPSGYVQAVAALHRGLPVGFAFTAQNGEHYEWAVRPVRFLTLV
ncbi:hypothetical protein [Streptomyces sp. NPDC001985]|uniref:hypothetical protein n=1 Tax=Streptomyces sp. NPDC001985 TaxID=3154406 RepID=UPI00332B1AC7